MRFGIEHQDLLTRPAPRRLGIGLTVLVNVPDARLGFHVDSGTRAPRDRGLSGVLVRPDVTVTPWDRASRAYIGMARLTGTGNVIGRPSEADGQS